MRSGRARPAWESFMGLPPRPSANWGAGPSLDRLRCAPGGRGRTGAPGRMRAPPAGRLQPAGGPGDSLPHPPGGLGPGGSAWARRAEAAASRARGGGRGGPGITWAEAGPGAPGGLSPESGRQQRELRRLLALSPSRAWAPSPTGERQPGERAHLRPSARPAIPGARFLSAPLSARDPGLVPGPAPRSLASAGAPPRVALSPAGALLLQPPARRVLCPQSEGGTRTGRAGPSSWAPPRGARSAESTDRLKGMVLTVDVAGPAPWGFRITGGRDFHTPIMVTKVAERGKAKDADLRPGDIIVAINGESAEGMLHVEAQSKIRQSPSPLRLQLDRSQAASPGQTNGDSSLEVLATRFQGSVRTHTESHSSLRSSYSSPTSLSPRAGSPFSPPPFSSPLTGEAAISRRLASAELATRRCWCCRLPQALVPLGPVWTRKGEASSWTRTRKSSRCSRKIARDGRPPDSPAPFGSCRKPWRLRREEPGCAHPGGPVSPPRLLHLRRLWAEPEDAWALLGG
ncbi:PDZ and LIM domain protein 2 isoform X3 [Piliocolobus tephrosceles]|uniref:PDZ and LIM domain protein 2 isoform X3 n=1 Tax=Piliocolobus tephrosceles TaxID=591936 RepID=UPI000C296632|nr:PDZ and LIM domain protein 2 isoform X3 [Piliocolobus tephrosceles]